MRLWSILLLALLLPCLWAQEQVPSEEAVDSPRSFPRSRLRPRLHRPTSTAPLAEEVVVEEIIVEEEQQATTAAAPTAKPRSRGKGRTGRTTPPPTPKEGNGAGDESTTAAAASTRRPGGKTRNRNRNRNRNKSTSTSPVPTDGTTTKGSKRRGSGRRTTTKATTDALATTSARPNTRSRNRSGSRNRNRSTTPKSATTLLVEEHTQRKGGRSRSKNQSSKPPRRSTTRKPTTVVSTTVGTTRTTTTTLRTTPLEEEELRNIPPIPLQRNPELLAPPPVKLEDKNMNPELDKNMKTMVEDQMMIDKAVPPITSRFDGPQLTVRDPSLVNANKPLRPLPVEGLILEEPLEVSVDAKPGKPSRVEDRAQLGIPLEGSAGKGAFENPTSRQEFEGVPPKLIGPVESKDLLLSKAIKENYDDPKSPVRPAPPKLNVAGFEDEEGKLDQEDPRSKLPIQNESLERKGLLSERNEGVPPKPIELVSIRPPKKTEELPSKSKANIADEALPVNAGRFGNDGSRLPERFPPNEREEERGVWSFDATIRPNLISSPSPIRSGSRRTSFEDLPTTPRSKSVSKETLSVKDSTNSRGSGAGRVTPFPLRFESVRSDEVKEDNDRSRQNTVSSRIPANPHGGFPNPFEEDDEPQFHRPTSSLKLKSRTTEPSVQLENSRNRLRSISNKDTDRLRANQLNVGRTEDIPSTTTSRTRGTFSPTVTNSDDLEITSKRPFRERTDVITPEDALPQPPPNPEAGGEGFIPLHTKLSFEDDIEEEPKNPPKPPFEVPPRSHLLAIENSSKGSETAKPKSGQRVSLDDDPFVVPPAEIGKFASKKAEESELPPKETPAKEISPKPKPQKATTTSWSKPVMDQDFTTKKFRAPTENPLVTLPEKGFSPRIPTDDGSFVRKSTVSDLSRNHQPNPSASHPELPSKPLPPAVPARERPSRIEAEVVPTQSRKLNAPQTDDKLSSGRGRETVSQFESPTFVIRKPYASPPPRGPKTPAPPPVSDYEAADSIPSRHSSSTENRPKIPTESRERTPVDTRDRTPVENRKPTHADKMPADDMDKMPADKMDKMPAEKMDRMPAEKMDKMPADKMDKMPVDKMDRMPADKMDRMPADKMEVDEMDKMPKTSSKNGQQPFKSREDQIADQRTQDDAVVPEVPATRPPPPPSQAVTTAAPDDYDDDYYDDEDE